MFQHRDRCETRIQSWQIVHAPGLGQTKVAYKANTKSGENHLETNLNFGKFDYSPKSLSALLSTVLPTIKESNHNLRHQIVRLILSIQSPLLFLSNNINADIKHVQNWSEPIATIPDETVTHRLPRTKQKHAETLDTC